MKSMELIYCLGNVKDTYVVDAANFRQDTVPAKGLPVKRIWMIAAVVSLMLMLVGCTVAYVSGWFADFFAARSDAPLTQDQVQYIKENEQVILQAQTHDGWTVALKSAISDGETGYLLFGITAPEHIDLEGTTRLSKDDPYIAVGNHSWGRNAHRALVVASTGPADPEQNFIWQEQGSWEADNDGLANTRDYLIELRCEKLYPNRERLLKSPFGGNVAFTVCFDDFTLESVDKEIRESLDAKYAGQDYLIGGEELAGLHRSEILAEGEWTFTVHFDMDASQTESLELVTDPVTVEAQVSRWMGEDHLTCDISSALEPVKLTSFLLTPLGAELQFEQEADVSGAFFEWQQDHHYGTRDIFVVMQDGSKIALHTNGVGTVLTADTPIVLSEVDYILFGNDTRLENLRKS